MTDQELKTLAIDYAEGKVYFSSEFGLTEVKQVFPLFTLLDKKEAKAMLRKGYYTAFGHIARHTLGQWSVNGKPQFWSMSMLTKVQFNKVKKYLKEYRALKGEFLGVKPESLPKKKTFTQGKKQGKKT